MSIERLGALAANFQTALNEYNMRSAEVAAIEARLAQAKERQDLAYQLLEETLGFLKSASAEQDPPLAPVRAK